MKLVVRDIVVILRFPFLFYNLLPNAFLYISFIFQRYMVPGASPVHFSGGAYFPAEAACFTFYEGLLTICFFEYF